MSKVNEKLALVVGALGVGLICYGVFVSQQAFFVAYLQAFGFWVAISLGCLGLMLLHGLVGGGWGDAVVPFLRSGVKTLPIAALLFVPIALGAKNIYVWMQESVVEQSPLIQAKQAYLNFKFFYGRTIFYFALWLGIGFWVLKKLPSKTGVQGLSGFFTLLFVLTTSFASFDWFMSTEPEWFSSIYGACFLSSCLLSTLAFLLVSSRVWHREFEESIRHDLGKLLFMSVMLWAYLNFSQYLIIWSGQLPEEMMWYHHRMVGGWQWVGLALILGHFTIPFCLLLSRKVKRKGKLLFMIAAFLLLMRFIDMWWLIAPAFQKSALSLPFWELAAVLGLGGLWLFWYARSYRVEAERISINPVKRSKEGGPVDR